MPDTFAQTDHVIEELSLADGAGHTFAPEAAFLRATERWLDAAGEILVDVALTRQDHSGEAHGLAEIRRVDAGNQA